MFKKEKKEKERDVASERNTSCMEEREMAVRRREKCELVEEKDIIDRNQSWHSREKIN